MPNLRSSNATAWWHALLSVMVTVTVRAFAGSDGQFAVVSVQCPGEATVIEQRSLAEAEATGGDECRERLVAVIDPEASALRAASERQLTQTVAISEKPGWPKTFTTFSGGSLTLAELGDARGLATVVDMEDGTVHAFAPDGQSLPGWPVPSPTTSNVAMAAVDLVGDLCDELLLAAGALHALSSEGEPLPGWPVTGGGFLGSLPVGARLEPWHPVRVVGAGALPPPVTGTTAGAFVLNEFGELLPGWPAVIPKGRFARPVAQGPAVGDVTGDGIAEVVVNVSNEAQVWVFASNGESSPGFPVTFGTNIDDPSLGDLDGDGIKEIVFWTGRTDPSVPSRGVAVLKGDGTITPGWPQVTNAIGNFGPAIGDLDGDGLPEVVASTVGGAGTGILGGGVYVWRHDGTPLPGWPKFIDFTGFARLPVVGDVDGDGLGDVVAVGGTSFLPQDTVVYAWKATGELVAGFPIMIPARSPGGPAIIADIDRDGIVDLGFTTWPGAFATKPARIHWFDLGVPYRPEGMQWPTWAHDQARTGSYTPPVRRVGMGLEISPPILNAITPAPKLKVEVTLPAGETAAPTSLILVKVDGAAVGPISGILKGKDGGKASSSKKLKFEFDGEQIKAVLGNPGTHTLTFRSEVIGGVGGIQFEGEAAVVLSGGGSRGASGTH